MRHDASSNSTRKVIVGKDLARYKGDSYVDAL
jgi:hypothetical protein